MSNIGQSIHELGFESLAEMNAMIAGLDISTPERLDRFNYWKQADGTKTGLIRINRENLGRPLRILSLGAGVQSTTLLLMSIEGVLPKLDAAIFADTQWEPKAVYQHLGRLATLAAAKGIPVIRATRGNIREDALNMMKAGRNGARREARNGRRWASLPLFVKNPDGTKGMIRRQCTKEYKIEVIEREVRRIAAIKPRSRPKDILVQQWIGISADEAGRMRDSRRRWQVNHYPLIYDFDPPMNRRDCISWLKSNNYPVPAKSACLACPFHSDKEWRAIKEDPEEWANVIEFDNEIRHCAGIHGEVYLHSSLKPLGEVNFSTAEERGQMNWINECTGMCGV